MDKKELRKEMKQKLTHLDEGTRREVEEKLTSQLLSSNLWRQANTIGITVSGGFEWNTEPWIRAGWVEGKRIAVPKCFPETKELLFYQLENDDQLEKSFYNLLEPDPEKTKVVQKKEMDLLIVPGLAFDKRGYRIGFGGGYYDRFLTDFSNQTISAFYSEQMIRSIPNESYDVPVQHLLTEKGFI